MKLLLVIYLLALMLVFRRCPWLGEVAPVAIVIALMLYPPLWLAVNALAATAP